MDETLRSASDLTRSTEMYAIAKIENERLQVAKRLEELNWKKRCDDYVNSFSGRKGKRKARRILGYAYRRDAAIRRAIGPDRV